jgi:hypothetical protein
MDMELDLVLNQIDSKCFLKMIKTKGFKNPKIQSQDQTRVCIKKKKKKLELDHNSFWNQELANTGPNKRFASQCSVELCMSLAFCCRSNVDKFPFAGSNLHDMHKQKTLQSQNVRNAWKYLIYCGVGSSNGNGMSII